MTKRNFQAIERGRGSGFEPRDVERNCTFDLREFAYALCAVMNGERLKQAVMNSYVTLSPVNPRVSDRTEVP